MLAGTLTFEDSTISYHSTGEMVTYHIVDSLSGLSATKQVPQKLFFAAMACCFSPDIIDNRQISYAELEAAMPEEEDLVDVHEAQDIEQALFILRWIP